MSRGVLMRTPGTRPQYQRDRSLGQSLTEFALFLPVLLLLVLVALDFGRVYLGWINLQQMARVAANFAANNAMAWETAGPNPTKDRYQELLDNEARQINCDLPDDIPDPVFAGTSLGAEVTVDVSCEFSLITPIISAVLGNSIMATGSQVFPIKEGVVATVPGGGAPIGIAPVADFTVSPRTGWSALQVDFTDTSLNGPTGWNWSFDLNPTSTGTGIGSVSDAGDLNEGPHTVTYTCIGAPLDTCTWSASLTVSNSTGTSSKQLDDWITVTVPPDTGPIAEFTGTPRTGTEPLDVDFSFVDLRGGSVTYTSWDWDFGDGTTGTGENVSHIYPDAGTYDVTLTVSDATTSSSPHTKDDYIIVNRQICTVPDFANTRTNQAQDRWEDAGFTTTVNFEPGPNNYVIQGQSIVGGTIDPQPDGCDSVITVGPTP
jgi:PKD repeat protein